MAKLKFRDENNEFIPVVQDVKVNSTSVFDGKEAEISLKTINNQSIVGSGNIEVQVAGEYVKYTPNQNLTTQQKTDARNNIDAVGNNQVKQQSGTSTTDIMSQNAVTTGLQSKQDEKPNGVNSLINSTGKIDNIYLPPTQGAVTSVNGQTGDVSITCDDINAVYKYQGYENRNKNVVTDAYGEISLADWPLGQIIVEYYVDLPTSNIPEKAEATVKDTCDVERYYTDSEFQDSDDDNTPLISDVYVRQTPFEPVVIGQEVTVKDVDYTLYVFYNNNFTYYPCFIVRATNMHTTDEKLYFYSWENQNFLPNPDILIKQDTWTEIWQDSLNVWHGQGTSWSNIPVLHSPAYVDTMAIEKDENFCGNLFYYEHKNSGKYIYEKITPITDPVTYYWKYQGKIANKPILKSITEQSTNISESNNVVTIIDPDVDDYCVINIYPIDTVTETWLNTYMPSKIISTTSGSFSFNVTTSLPVNYKFNYLITKVDVA